MTFVYCVLRDDLDLQQLSASIDVVFEIMPKWRNW